MGLTGGWGETILNSLGKLQWGLDRQTKRHGDAKCLEANLWSLTSVLSGCHAPGLPNTGFTFQLEGFISSQVFADGYIQTSEVLSCRELSSCVSPVVLPLGADCKTQEHVLVLPLLFAI